MPKVNKRKAKIQKWLEEIKDDGYIYDGDNVLCLNCDKFIRSDRKSQLTQHLQTNLHMRESALEHTASEKDEALGIELCEAMVSANIPWHTINNKKLKSFLAKYTNRNIPDESTLRKNYLDKCYEKKISTIREDIGNNYIWASVDETTDAAGRYVANLIVGKLTEHEASTPHLIVSQEIEQVNHSSIARFVNNGLRKLWPEGAEDKLLLLTTDAAAYMIAAGRDLKTFYSNMVHVTCLAHGVHRIAELIRSSFPTVNAFISAVKKVFLKSPKRIQTYKQMLNIQLPPEPILTRWGTWLKAVVFYATHFQGIKQVIQTFDSKDAECVATAKTLLESPELLANIIYIKSNFEALIGILTTLETRGLPLKEQLQLMKNVEAVIDNISGDLGTRLRDKFKAILKRNVDFDTVTEINTVLSNPSFLLVNAKEVVKKFAFKFKYAPLTSVEVERSFSAYKMIFSDKRQSLSSGSMNKLLVLYCN